MQNKFMKKIIFVVALIFISSCSENFSSSTLMKCKTSQQLNSCSKGCTDSGMKVSAFTPKNNNHILYKVFYKNGDSNIRGIPGCRIIDKKNWDCTRLDRSSDTGTAKMINGHFIYITGSSDHKYYCAK